MTEAELLAWGEAELQARMRDIAAAKEAGDTSAALEACKASARRRRLDAGLSMSKAGRAVMAAGRARRKAT